MNVIQRYYFNYLKIELVWWWGGVEQGIIVFYGVFLYKQFFKLCVYMVLMKIYLSVLNISNSNIGCQVIFVIFMYIRKVDIFFFGFSFENII